MTYWNRNGKFQELSEKLGKLIPMSGSCDNLNLEFFRVVRNAYYDIYNNGACNPGRFEDVLVDLNTHHEDQVKAIAPFSDEEYDTLHEWLSLASSEKRSFYLVTEPSNEEEKQILDLFERLADASIAIASQAMTE